MNHIEAHDRVIELFQTLIPDAQLINGPSLDEGTGPDFYYQIHNRFIVPELSTVATARHSDVIGQLVTAVLELPRNENYIPVAIVACTRLGQRTVDFAETLMLKLAPDVGWGLFDNQGTVRLYIPAFEIDVRESAGRPPTHQRRRQDTRMFTDLNRWLLKVLLLTHAPPNLWGGPRQSIAHPTELARVAGVSIEKAHRFARTFEAKGFLRRTGEGLRLIRKPEILDTWLQDEQLTVRTRLPARWIFGDVVSLEKLVPASTDYRYAVGGFEACRGLGLLHATPRHPELHVGNTIESVLDALDLEPSDPRDAHIFLLQTRYPESIFRATVRRSELVLVDIVQAALDVSTHEARGLEQAEFLIERILSYGEGNDA